MHRQHVVETHWKCAETQYKHIPATTLRIEIEKRRQKRYVPKVHFEKRM
jgi:hypothetical protein